MGLSVGEKNNTEVMPGEAPSLGKVAEVKLEGSPEKEPRYCSTYERSAWGKPLGPGASPREERPSVQEWV